MYDSNQQIVFSYSEPSLAMVSEHICSLTTVHRRTGLMGAVARFLEGPGIVSLPATDSAGSVYVYAHTQKSRSSALSGAMLGELALSRSRSRRSYTGAPIVGIARWSVPRIGQGHLEVKW